MWNPVDYVMGLPYWQALGVYLGLLALILAPFGVWLVVECRGEEDKETKEGRKKAP